MRSELFLVSSGFFGLLTHCPGVSLCTHGREQGLGSVPEGADTQHVHIRAADEQSSFPFWSSLKQKSGLQLRAYLHAYWNIFLAHISTGVLAAHTLWLHGFTVTAVNVHVFVLTFSCLKKASFFFFFFHSLESRGWRIMVVGAWEFTRGFSARGVMVNPIVGPPPLLY